MIHELEKHELFFASRMVVQDGRHAVIIIDGPYHSARLHSNEVMGMLRNIYNSYDFDQLEFMWASRDGYAPESPRYMDTYNPDCLGNQFATGWRHQEINLNLAIAITETEDEEGSTVSELMEKDEAELFRRYHDKVAP